MAGKADFGADSDRHAKAVEKVVESGEAATSSAQGASSLSAAQKTMFWGEEDGPKSMGNSSAKLFDVMSELLAKEAELISTFEKEINAALKRCAGMEQDNKLQLAQIQETLNRVDKSDAAVAAKAARHKLDKFLGSLGIKPITLPTKQSGTNNSTATGGSAPTTTAGPRKY